jgi:hypothetical protein
MGKFKDNKEKNNEKDKYLKMSTFGKYLGWKEKKEYICEYRACA